MSNNRLLIIHTQTGNFRVAELLSDANLAEFNAIVWDAQTFSSELQAGGWNNTVLTETHGKRLRARIVERIRVLQEWVKKGNVLIVLWAAGPTIIYRHGGASESFSINSLFPLNKRTTPLSGEMVEYAGPRNVAVENLLIFLPYVEYETQITESDASPLLKVSQGRQAGTQMIAAYWRVGDGALAYVPPLRQAQWADHNTRGMYFSALADVIAAAIGDRSKIEAPSWIVDFQTKDERTSRQNISSVNAQIETLQNQILIEEEKLVKYQSDKILLFGTGQEFASAVQDALIELGFAAAEGPHPRADILATDGTHIVAVEAKGVEGAAREFDFRQTAQWVSDLSATLSATSEDLEGDPHLTNYARVLSIRPAQIDGSVLNVRGLMVIGTFRKQPLTDRSEPDFSNDLINAIGRSDVCALTGLQLFVLLMRARRNPSLKPSIVNAITTTSGVLQDGLEWDQILEKI